MTVEGIRSFARGLLGKDLQRNITRECNRAFRAGGHEFPAKIALPSPYGKGLPERVVELLLARLSYTPGMKVLDVGHGNSMACHRDMIRSLPAPRHLTGIDMAVPVFDPSKLYDESVCADIGATTFPDATFDLIWCISTLEHIGMDNSGYSHEMVAGGTTAASAISEMVRIARPLGSILITVPYGRYEDHGWFRNYDRSRLQDLLDVIRPRAGTQELYFAHSRQGGWSSSDPHDLEETGYRDQENAGAAALAAVLIVKKG